MPPPADLCRLFLLPGGGARGCARCLAVPVAVPVDLSRTGGNGEKGLGEPAGPADQKRPSEALLTLISAGKHGLPQVTSPDLGAILQYLGEPRRHPGMPRHHPRMPRHRPDSDRLLAFTYPGGKAPSQARSVKTPASEPGHSSGNNTPKHAPKGEP